MENNFSYEIYKDSGFEEMVVDISYKGSLLAMLSFDNGPEEIDIEIFPAPRALGSWNFPLDEFYKVVETAKEDLMLVK
jgi:hypothetical protein